jgi:hypothetical protein
MPASARPSVSHGIVEDQSELLSGFATAGDGQSESAVEYADEYWDSDTYEDDDDPGYLRQPIEDEEWFLAHEIDYPSDDERARPNVENPRGSRREKDQEKYEDEDCTFMEEEASSSLCSFSAHFLLSVRTMENCSNRLDLVVVPRFSQSGFCRTT